jgi:hypothetical protein
MGNLVDTFIITPKKEWAQLLYAQENTGAIVPYVPPPYRPMIKALLDTFGYMDRIMDNRDYEMAYSVWKTARSFEKEDVVFRRRYREECLQQVVRTIFYDTLLIIENDFNPEKYNYFVVVHSRDIVSEKEWRSRMPEDQSFLNKTMESLAANGFRTVMRIDESRSNGHPKKVTRKAA